MADNRIKKQIQEVSYSGENFRIGDVVYGLAYYDLNSHSAVYQKPFKAIVKEITLYENPQKGPDCAITFDITEKENGGKYWPYDTESVTRKKMWCKPFSKNENVIEYEKREPSLSHDLNRIVERCSQYTAGRIELIKNEAKEISRLRKILENAKSTLQNVTFS